MVNIIVCVKQVIDPEAPVSYFKVDTEAKRVIPPKGTPPVLNPFDENALEAALRIKDTQEAQVTVLSMGPSLAKPIVKQALAAGADELIILEDPIFEGLDSYSSAYILATAIKKIGKYDLILCGRQASDTDAGQVGSGIAEILEIPSITIARKVETNGGKARIERVLPDGYEVVEASMPALVTVGNEHAELREASVAAFVAAQKKPITTWNIQELGIDDPSRVKRTNLLKLYQPVHEAKCEMIQAETPEEAGANLALKLRENKVL